MNKKLLSIVLSCLMLVIFLTACTKKVSDENTDLNNQNSQQPNIEESEISKEMSDSLADAETDINVDDLDTNLESLEQDLADW